jgi:hypothetical protein
LKLNEIEPCAFIYCEIRYMCLRYKLKKKLNLNKQSAEELLEFYIDIKNDYKDFGTLECPKVIKLFNLKFKEN